jgi:sulfur dioxygenase
MRAGGLVAAQEQEQLANPDEGHLGYVFEQFRVERGCLGYVVADRGTRRAAIVDPEIEMVEPMLDFVFEQGLKPF